MTVSISVCRLPWRLAWWWSRIGSDLRTRVLVLSLDWVCGVGAVRSCWWARIQWMHICHLLVLHWLAHSDCIGNTSWLLLMQRIHLRLSSRWRICGCDIYGYFSTFTYVIYTDYIINFLMMIIMNMIMIIRPALQLAVSCGIKNRPNLKL